MSWDLTSKRGDVTDRDGILTGMGWDTDRDGMCREGWDATDRV